MWHWLTQTDAGLLTRIAFGVIVFTIAAVVDLQRKQERATRWREYAFLLACVLAALLYGILNDQITCSISWEYFYYGKELADVSGSKIPPEAWPFRWEVAKVGMKATWTAGLVIGVALLLANNPSRTRAALSFKKMLAFIPLPLCIAAGSALIFGALGAAGVFTHFSADFSDMVRHNEMRPDRFMAVFGIHLGGYIGGILGTIVTVWQIRKRRLPTAQ